MTPDDVVVGFPLGHVRRSTRFSARAARDPREAMEEAVLPALHQPPCVVGFSGGRDSSAVLAVAVHVARREGLPAPIPVTRIFPGVPQAEESEWQDLVVRHLELTDWIREHVTDEMDVIGPLAQPRLLRHGVLWSPLLHGDEFFLRHARGGSVLDGEGGDDICDPRPHRVTPLARMIRRGRRPTRWELRAALGAVAPAPLRGLRAAGRGLPAPQPWLRAPARAIVADRWKLHVQSEPLDARRSIMHVLARRSVVELQHNRNYFAALAGVQYVSPFYEPSVAAAIAGRAGPLGFTSRAAGLATVCEGLLPDEVLARRTKAEFNATFFGLHTRAFAEDWSGSGLDPSLIDLDILRAVWRSEEGNALSAALLQTAWLADAGEK